MSGLPEGTSKEFAADGKGAVAGDPEPTPGKSSMEAIADRHGLGTTLEGEIALTERLERRDQARWELNADSAPSLDQ